MTDPIHLPEDLPRRQASPDGLSSGLASGDPNPTKPECCDHGSSGVGDSVSIATLKDFRYVVASVDAQALRLWGEIWQEFQSGVTPAGAVTSSMSEGFRPACGWPELLEKFWLLKHHLDYLLRFSREADLNPYSPHHQLEENTDVPIR